MVWEAELAKPFELAWASGGWVKVWALLERRELLGVVVVMANRRVGANTRRYRVALEIQVWNILP